MDQHATDGCMHQGMHFLWIHSENDVNILGRGKLFGIAHAAESLGSNTWGKALFEELCKATYPVLYTESNHILVHSVQRERKDLDYLFRSGNRFSYADESEFKIFVQHGGDGEEGNCFFLETTPHFIQLKERVKQNRSEFYTHI